MVGVADFGVYRPWLSGDCLVHYRINRYDVIDATRGREGCRVCIWIVLRVVFIIRASKSVCGRVYRYQLVVYVYL